MGSIPSNQPNHDKLHTYSHSESVANKGRALTTTLSLLLQRLNLNRSTEVDIIPWSSPVLSFGDLSSARIATLGLNPSNREFVDTRGQELDGPARRFPTLKSLGLASWSDASDHDTATIWQACCEYFHRNPYDGWFRQLDYLLGSTGTTYYSGGACHLDLIPYATSQKWTNLARAQRVLLLSIAGDTLGLLLRPSRIKILVLNGRSVVDAFEALSGSKLESQSMTAWKLNRGSGRSVHGLAFRGYIDSLAGIPFDRRLLVLGFNHNIQSSFGVTSQVRASIRAWIGQAAKEWSHESA